MVDEVGPAYLAGVGVAAQEGSPMTPWAPHPYSDETARHVDAAIKRLICEAYACACTLLKANRRTLDAVAAALLEEESLDREQLTTLVGAADPRVRDILSAA
jgi:ATP-dependent Zn protease